MPITAVTLTANTVEVSGGSEMENVVCSYDIFIFAHLFTRRA